jgi:hypothetical protein
MTAVNTADSQDAISDCTIIVLAKNHEQYLSDCLRSIHRELPRLKVLCADIGSRDKSFEKGKEIANILKMKSRHVQLSEDTKTLTSLKKIEPYIDTKYVILLSADDALGEGYGDAVRGILTKAPSYLVINFISVVSDQNLKPMYSKYPRWTNVTKKNIRRLSYSNLGNAPGAVIPWEILVNIPCWNHPPKIIIEDYWLWWQLINRVPFVNSKESYVLYRQHSNNVSKARKNKDYAYSLGYVSALPNVKSSNVINKLLSLVLIPRWIRHLNINVWEEYARGYLFALRNEVTQ